MCRITSSVLPAVTVSHATPSQDCAVTLSKANHELVSEGAQVQSTAAVTQADPSLSHSDDVYLNDIELLCTIADTYELGGDSDTLSYISNCLHNTKPWPLYKQTSYVTSQQAASQTSMLESDQLYPESNLSHKPYKTKSRKQRHKRSDTTNASSNVYVTAKGNPLII